MLIFWICVIALVIACMISVCVRVVVRHPFLTVFYGIKDFIHYISHKMWRIPDTGRIICYMGMFRKGKTLSGVDYIVNLYRQYDGLKVYDIHRKKWVTQKVHVVSNVEFKTIPYEFLTSLEQVVYISETTKQKDIDNDTLTIHVIFVDEASVQFNSRAFKSNMDPLFLNSLLTLGHVHMLFVYTAQRFIDVDALLRRVTSYCISCNKCWRIMVQHKYDAYELEYAPNPLDVQYISKFGWFIRDRSFNSYDTLACVENLKKDFEEGNMMSESEILALQCNTPADMDAVQKPSKAFFRRQKRNGRKVG